MSEIRFGLASGRGKCRICSKIIERDDPDIIANLGSGLYAKVYHVKCFKSKHWGFIKELYNGMTEAEREDLSREN